MNFLWWPRRTCYYIWRIFSEKRKLLMTISVMFNVFYSSYLKCTQILQSLDTSNILLHLLPVNISSLQRCNNRLRNIFFVLFKCEVITQSCDSRKMAFRWNIRLLWFWLIIVTFSLFDIIIIILINMIIILAKIAKIQNFTYFHWKFATCMILSISSQNIYNSVSKYNTMEEKYNWGFHNFHNWQIFS